MSGSDEGSGSPTPSFDPGRSSEKGFHGGYGSSDLLGKISSLFKESLNSEDPTFLFSILFTCFIVFVTIFVFIVRRKSYRGNNVILLGLSNSGKTLLYCKLALNQAKDTYISIKENQGTFTYKDEKVSKSVKIIDIPGQESIRLKFFEQFKTSAKAILFVIDSASFQKDLKDVAEYFYTILTCLPGYQLPILVACNKQDLALAKGASLIKSALEKELNHVHHTRSVALQGIDGKTVSTVSLGNSKKEFTFSDLRKTTVEFAEFSAKQENDDGLQDIKKWIANI